MCALAAVLLVPGTAQAQPGTISTVAGHVLDAQGRQVPPGFSGDNGPATQAQLSDQAYGIALDAAGNLYIADSNNNRIRFVNKSTGVITTIAGTGATGFSGDGGPALAATFNFPLSVAVDSQGNIYVSDCFNDRIRKIGNNGIITTVVGNATNAQFDGDTPKAATSAHLANPFGIAVDSQDNLYIADTGNQRIRKVTKSTGQISTVAGSGTTGCTGGGCGGYNGDGKATAVLLNYPSFVAVDTSLNVYIADDCNQRVRKVTISTGNLTTIAGNTTPGCKNTAVTDFAGDGGPGTAAHLSHPYGVAVDTAGNVYIADYFNFVIRKVAPNGIISTIAGIPGQPGASTEGESTKTARLADPVGVLVDPAGNVYIMDQSSFRVRKLTVGTLPKNDLDGDRKADVLVWRSTTGTFYPLTSSTGYTFNSANAKGLGGNGDIPFTADLDGDGKADLVVWRPSTGAWFWLTSSNGFAGGVTATWGCAACSDVPLLGDIDGDGKADLVVWRATTGTFYPATSSTGYQYSPQYARAFGGAGDVPFLADVDGDGRADMGLWRPSNGTWYWLFSTANYSGGMSVAWGCSTCGDVPLVGDLDGDRKADLIVWRSTTGGFYPLTSSTGYQYNPQNARTLGGAGDSPLLADFDGDGRDDMGLWRPSNGTWYWLMSTANYSGGMSVPWGCPSCGDKPVVGDRPVVK